MHAQHLSLVISCCFFVSSSLLPLSYLVYLRRFSSLILLSLSLWLSLSLSLCLSLPLSFSRLLSIFLRILVAISRSLVSLTCPFDDFFMQWLLGYPFDNFCRCLVSCTPTPILSCVSHTLSLSVYLLHFLSLSLSFSLALPPLSRLFEPESHSVGLHRAL